jgi:triosephosphate isomerase
MAFPSARQRIRICGNWKMNHGPMETTRFLTEATQLWKKPEESGDSGSASRVYLYIPATNFQSAVAAIGSLPIHFGAQNAHGQESGPFTGEISGKMLHQVGIQSVLVGHSERRQHFGETDENVRIRTEGLLAQGFQVLVCIGETGAQREQGMTEQVLDRQLRPLFPSITGQTLRGIGAELVLAYEPVWAIGTGITATVDQIRDAHQTIRKIISARYGEDRSDKLPILYGGSVNTDNAKSILEISDVDGLLVGAASLRANAFNALIEIGNEVTKSRLSS